MVAERSATGAGFPPPGGDDEAQRAWKFMHAVTGKFEQLDKGLKGITDVRLGSLKKLDSALAALTKTIDGLNKTLGGSTIQGAGGKINPSSFSGKPAEQQHAAQSHPFRTAATGVALLSAYSIARNVDQSITDAIGFAPGLTGLQAYSGGGPNTRQIAGMFAEGKVNPFTLGTQGPNDTLASARAATRFASDSIAGSRTSAVAGNFGSLAISNPGMSRAGAADLYRTLSSPQAINGMKAFYGTSLLGPGGRVNNIAQVASQIASRAAGSGASAQKIRETFQYGAGPYQQLSQITGSQDAADSLIQLAISQSTFNAHGGRGNINFNNANDVKRAGLSDPVLSETLKLGKQRSKGGFEYYRDRSDVAATAVKLQRKIEKVADDFAHGSGWAGLVLTELKRATALLGGTGVGTAVTAFLGARGGSGAGRLGSLFSAGGAVEKIGAGATTLGVAAAIGTTIGNAISDHLPDFAPGKGKKHSVLDTFSPSRAWHDLSAPFVDIAHGNFKDLLTGKGDPGIGDPAGDVLSPRNRSGGGPTEITGLNPGLRNTVAQMFRDNPRLVLNSGFRSHSNQQRLWNEAIRKYGSAAAARKWVAPPGTSMHERGLAVDIGPSSEYGWLKANAPKYKLWNYSPEPWHWEPQGARSGSGGGDGASSGGGGMSSTGTTSVGSAAGGGSSGLGGGGAGIGGLYGQASEKSLVEGIIGNGTQRGVNAPSIRGGLSGSGGVAGASVPPSGGGSAPTGASGTGGGVIPGSMGINALAAILRRAGFSGAQEPGNAGFAGSASDLEKMLAISIRESGLRPGAVGDVKLQNGTWGPSIGLFQIRSLKAQRGTGQSRDELALRGSAEFQAQSAFGIAGGGSNWSAWTGWGGHDSDWQKNLPRVRAALQSGVGDPPINDSGGARGSSGGSTAVAVRSGSPISATFKIYVQQATPTEALRLAQIAHGHIERLAQQAQLGST